jgi:gliding motility-associated-like protein
MKLNRVIPATLLAMSTIAINAQSKLQSSTIDTLINFNTTKWINFYNSKHTSQKDLQEFLTSQQRDYIKDAFFSHAPKSSGQSSRPQAACTNIDFENGNLTGWTTSTGYNPLYNPLGCCATSGGAQAITSGLGLDACGGFPIVAPGGTFSLKLGNNAVNGIADRIEQTFFVTSANANFMYRYAVVFEDPGHTVANQPSFVAEMLDSSGVQIPCTYYSVSAGAGIPGFLNSTGCTGVVYKPWSNVSIDLTSYIGQNVTIKFMTQDCALGGHFAYAYIDGSCSNFNINQNNILCAGSSIQLTAPLGFATYTWTLPNGTFQLGQTINTGLAGVYTLNMTTMTGCPGPTLTYTLIEYPKPNSNFTPTQITACSPNFTFTNTSTISVGYIASSSWNFGDGFASYVLNTNHNYLSLGNYSVSLISTSNMGCIDTTIIPVSIQPAPIPSFTLNTVCLNNTTTFTNTSSLSSGTISNYNWQFGDGTSSTLASPTHIYGSSGSFTTSLTVTSIAGCSETFTQVAIINPLPNVALSVTNNCLGSVTSYTNLSTITSGIISQYFWDYNFDGTTDHTTLNGSNTFLTAGNYTTQLTVISNFNCSATQLVGVTVYPNPVASFTTHTVCYGYGTQFTNASTISSGSITNYQWQFGDSTSSLVSNPIHTYSSAGIHNVLLTITSNHNCSSSYSTMATVYPKPTPNFTSSIVCFNQATTFTNSSSVSSGTINKYLWDFDNNGTNDDSTLNPVHIYPIWGTTLCKLKIISNYHCENHIIHPILVHANPIAQFYAPSTCVTHTTAFTNNSTSVDGLITSTNWDFNADFIPDAMTPNPNHYFSVAGIYPVQLDVQTQYGCKNTLLKNVYINAMPVISFDAENNSGCPILCVNFTNSCTISSGSINQYQWDFGDGSPINTSPFPTHCYQTGIYSVTLKAISDSGCLSGTMLPEIVTVYPSPQAGFHVTPTSIDILEPLIEVTDQSMGANTIVYKFDDGTIKTTRNFNHTFNTTYAKKVSIMQIAVNTNGCRDSIAKIIDIKPAFTIYIPNAFTPNSDGINDGFRASGIGIKEFNMQIYDRWGNLIFESDDINKAWDGSVNGKGDYENAKQDVYVWKATVKDVLLKTHDLIGHVSLVK